MKINSLSFCIPTYNRASSLSELLNSIIKNHSLIKIDYEILIINDGGIDKTKEVIDKFYTNNSINKIRYFYQSNKGRAETILKLINLTSKKYLMILDDDDLLPDDFFKKLEIINNYFDQYKEKYNDSNRLAGISFLCSDDNNKLIGDTFKKNYMISNFFNVLVLDKKSGDSGDILETNVLKNNLYRIQKNEKRASTGLLHLKISKNYNFVFINSVLKIKRYFDDGISKNILYFKTISPNYSVEYEKLLLSYKKLPILTKLRCYINISRFYLHGANRINLSNIDTLFIYLLFILALFIYFWDKIKLKNKFTNLKEK